jgi:UDP:flavonoid glycosyltransferase YjiC (YdhE family)
MRILMAALGSAGDVHPFVGIGRELARRGHEVVVYANEVFAETITGAGLGFVAAGDAETYRRMTEDPDLFHPRRGPKLIFGAMAERLRELEVELRERVVPGRTVMVGSSLALAARLVQETDGVPLATVHLAPSLFRSLHEMPRLPAGPPIPSGAPRWLKRAFWRFADLLLDSIVAAPLNAERRHLGLAPVRRVLDEWWNSPELVIGLFPDWFAPRQPDWPPQSRLTGFPLFDEAEVRRPDPELDAWLAADGQGGAPVVLTAGSAQRNAREYFEAAVAALGTLGRRGLLLTGAPRDVPEEVEGSGGAFLHRAYAPFGTVFPRAAAVVHHGGIGTTAQGFAAGIPQLVVPFAHDQPDNGARVERLGAGAVLPAKRFRADRAAKALERLLASDEVAARCRDLAGRIRASDPVAETCDLIEGLDPHG